MSQALEAALAANRDQVQRALEEAERELAALVAREDELRSLIARGRAALGLGASTAIAAAGDDKRTLHQAIEIVLREVGGGPLHVSEIARAVNQRGLYTKRDRSPVESNQIHARTKNYPSLFVKDGPNVRLRKSAS